jgi:hypothetical protein
VKASGSYAPNPARPCRGRRSDELSSGTGPEHSLGLGGGIVCGADSGSPVWDKYKPPFKFTGTLFSSTVDVSGELIKDEEAAMRMLLVRQ